MRSARIFQIGPPNVIVNTEIERPTAGENQLLIRVKAAGVGPWDALIREGKSGVSQSLPLTLGSDLSGIVDAVGPGVLDFKAGDAVFGVTNGQFTGAYAEYALASAGKIARKPTSLSFIEAASVPVVAVTAWQMLFEYAHVVADQSVLILGAAGNVGAYAVQLAKHMRVHVFATASAHDTDYVRRLGADRAMDYLTVRLEELGSVDAVLDTVGGESRDRSLELLKRNGVLVSSVSEPFSDKAMKAAKLRDATEVFFMVDVTTARLNLISELFNKGVLVTQVGTVLPLEEARSAHEMLAGAAHNRGKIVLKIAS